VVADHTLFDNAMFVLAARPTWRRRTCARACSCRSDRLAEKIRDLVNLQLPGAALRSMAWAPRQIPYHAGPVTSSSIARANCGAQ